MAADSDKCKMSRLLNLARKFNCFYLSGKKCIKNNASSVLLKYGRVCVEGKKIVLNKVS